VYVAHYKSVHSANEFYSSKRKSLDFPTQVEHKGSRYFLHTTHIVATKSQESNIKIRAKELGIPFGVKLD
jgi:hypothetical protein